LFVELIDQLRCLRPPPHEESWLVASAERTVDRDIMDGILGCPICRAQYPIARGIAHFGLDRHPARSVLPDEQEAMRLAAFLDLADPRGYAVITASLGAHAPLLRQLTDVQLLLVNPPAEIQMGGGLSGLTVAETLPLAAGSARGVAVDSRSSPELLRSAVAAVAPGGRIMAPATFPVPSGVKELVRDDRVWVAERQPEPSTSRPIALHRHRG
jgi:hypothetical protein